MAFRGRTCRLRTRGAVAISSLLLIQLYGCGPGEKNDASPAADAEEALPVHPASPSLETYRTPPGFPLPFSTSIPGYLHPEPSIGEDGAAVSFMNKPEEAGGDSALVHIFVFPAEASESVAREVVRTAAAQVKVPGDRTELNPIVLHPWATVEYPIDSRGRTDEAVLGWVALGRAGDHWFQLTAKASAPLWPRLRQDVERMLSNWRWSDAAID